MTDGQLRALFPGLPHVRRALYGWYAGHGGEVYIGSSLGDTTFYGQASVGTGRIEVRGCATPQEAAEALRAEVERVADALAAAIGRGVVL